MRPSEQMIEHRLRSGADNSHILAEVAEHRDRESHDTPAQVQEPYEKIQGKPRKLVGFENYETQTKAARLDELAKSHHAQFRLHEEMNEIENAIEYGTRALDLTPDGHQNLPARLSRLGSFYYDRFQRLGELEDIEKSIEYETRALDLTPQDHPDLPDRLGKLTRALDLTPQGHPNLCDTRALDLTPKDHPDLPDRLDTLGSSYYDRFQHVGELEDIQRSIKFKTRAVDLTPQDHPKLPDRLASLDLGSGAPSFAPIHSLSDGTLDLASINRRSFKNKGLAFLSACQTATGDEQLPDEAIHLASGMLMAGYSSVIATMWSVRDEDAPFVADKVYAKLMKDGKLGNGEAGKALHHAVAELRNKIGEQKFECWVPYIHIGS
ncbi:CHAT domain protein, partial [Rhizoctonia solani AG-3 Rhs1AP]